MDNTFVTREDALDYFISDIFKGDEENSELVKVDFERWLEDESIIIISELSIDDADFSGASEDNGEGR
jgi:hypothetical protein